MVLARVRDILVRSSRLGGGAVIRLASCWVGIAAAKERIHGLGITAWDLALGVVSASRIGLALTCIGRSVVAPTGSIYRPLHGVGADIDVWRARLRLAVGVVASVGGLATIRGVSRLLLVVPAEVSASWRRVAWS